MEKLILSQKRKKIIALHRKERDRRIADRLKTILLLDAGWSYSEVSKILLLDENTTRRYKKLYLEEGLDALLKLSYIGSKTLLKDDQKEDLKKHLSEKIYLSTKEICSYVCSKYNVEYSYQGMAKLLKRLGFVYKKPKVIPGKLNPDKQKEFISRYEDLKKNLKKDEKIYFVDSAHPQHNSKPAYGWILKGKNKFLKSNTGRKRINISGALNLKNREIIVGDYETINSKTTIEFFKKIEKNNRNVRRVSIICDNAKYFYSKEVREYLKNSKIKIMFLPPYSPNLNIIERLWKFFHKKITYNKYYETFGEFYSKTMDFFSNVRNFSGELCNLLTDNFQKVI